MKDKYLNKDYEVTKLLIDLVDTFGDNIIFTGGTSLLKRNLIDRFSEDLDIISKVSRKQIHEFLEYNDNYEIVSFKSGSRVNTYGIISDGIEIKLDVVPYKIKVKVKDTKIDTETISVSSLNNRIIQDSNFVVVRNVDEIYIDKISAIFEQSYDINKFLTLSNKFQSRYSESDTKNKFLVIDADYDVRLFRHFYDVAKIYNSDQKHYNNILIGNLSAEMLRRDKLIDFNTKGFNSILRFINDNKFEQIYNDFSVQVIDESNNLDEIRQSINAVMNSSNLFSELIKFEDEKSKVIVDIEK